MTGWTTGLYNNNGIQLHYLRTGNDKPPVVLLHGLMTNGACWTPIARRLEKDYDVIMPDARGHGHSSAPESGYHYNDLAADVIGLMDALKLPSFALIGHSMGGMTAAVIASSHPERVRRLVLADPPFLPPERQREVYESDVTAQHRQVLSRPREELIAAMRARPRPRSLETIELLTKARFQTSLFAFEVLKPPNPDYMELIRLTEVPTMLVTGDEDAIVSPKMAAELALLNDRLEFVQIEQAGHGLPYDQPESFSAIVQTFISKT